MDLVFHSGWPTIGELRSAAERGDGVLEVHGDRSGRLTGCLVSVEAQRRLADIEGPEDGDLLVGFPVWWALAHGYGSEPNMREITCRRIEWRYLP
jgi:hypothetical protein